MTRTEFVRAYCDVRHEGRKKLSSVQEAEAHIADRAEAARLWRKQKNRLQNLTPAEWKKQEDKQS
jgi:hypothetical protein